MAIYLYNTLGKEKQRFEPLEENEVKLYACGPTVYGPAHIGNLRSFIFADVLRRTLEYNGYKVRHVMNITDVGHLTSDADSGQDKMSKGLRREGMDLSIENMKRLGEKYANIFIQDLKELNVGMPHVVPKASEHIEEDIELILKLEEKGYTYKTSDGLYFDTKKFDQYGALRKTEADKEYSRVEGSEKKDPRDFALWKFNDDLGWNSPWGHGFPGWHIECSVMSTEYLGQPFDIHTGGIDLIPVHHTNEIAQSEAAYDKPMANFWMHGEFLVVEEGRMGKSEGNFITLETLKNKGYDPLAYRYLCLQTHYRQQLMFSWEALDGATNALRRLRERVLDFRKQDEREAIEHDLDEQFSGAINDDLNMPQALAIVWEVVRHPRMRSEQKLELLYDFDQVLGLGLQNVEREKVPKEVQRLVDERERARQAKEFSRADALRERIKKKGYVVEDTTDGPRVKRV